MTVFRIINNVEKNFVKRLFYTVFDKNTQSTLINFEGIYIRYINYCQRGKKVYWKKISKMLNNKDEVICNDELIFPDKYNIRRFKSSDFNKVICVKTVFNIIKYLYTLPQKLKICLYDPYAQNINLLEKLVKFSSELTVMTDAVSIYLEESNRLFYEFGVSVIIKNCNDIQNMPSIIIAPDKIEKKLNIHSDSVIFTSQCPKVFLDAKLFYGYKLQIPRKYMSIIPNDIDPDYFLSALYDIHKLKEVAGIRTKYLVSYNKYIMLEDVLKQIKKLMICGA